MSETKPCRIIPDHPKLKEWNAQALIDEAEAFGGEVTQCDVDADGADLFCFEHPRLGVSADLFRSEAMAAACMLQDLRVYLCDRHYGDDRAEALNA